MENLGIASAFPVATLGFVEYFSTIRPWLASQSSVMLRPDFFDESATGPFFAIRSSEEAPNGSNGEAKLVGSWTEIAGNNGTKWNLYAGDTYQKLIASEAVTSSATTCSFMAPLGFSPMQ